MEAISRHIRNSNCCNKFLILNKRIQVIGVVGAVLIGFCTFSFLQATLFQVNDPKMHIYPKRSGISKSR